MKRPVRDLVLAGAAVPPSIYLLSLPMLSRLPRQDRVSVDGVTTIREAVEACRRTGLDGWPLVEYAQRLAARKFTYSRLNPWDSPSRAFERGMGYCQQQALALKRIYDGLGIEAHPVFAARCRFPGKRIDGIKEPGGISGHVWLRVQMDGEERDVCPGSVDNRPGKISFEVLSPVRALLPAMRPFTHFASVLENMRRFWRARLFYRVQT